jgi:hypothetical protein
MFSSSAKQAMDPLERESREIERRRARNEDRAARVLHAKTRIMGVSPFMVYLWGVDMYEAV